MLYFTKEIKIKFPEIKEPELPIRYGMPLTTNGQYYTIGRWVYDYAGKPVYVYYTTGTG